MKVLFLFVTTIAVSYSCHSESEKNHAKRCSQNKTLREKVEAFTTIILGNESYSIEPVIKNPRNLSSWRSRKTKGAHLSRIKTPGNHHFRGSDSKTHKIDKTKPSFTISLADKAHPSKEIYSKKKGHMISPYKHRVQTPNQTKKKIRKRHFEGSRWKLPKIRRQSMYQAEAGNPTVLTPFPVRPQVVVDAKPLNSSYRNFLLNQPSGNPVGNAGYSNSRQDAAEPVYKASENARLEPSNSKRDRFPNQNDNLNENAYQAYDENKNSEDGRFHEPDAERSYGNDNKRSDTETKYPPTMKSVTLDAAESSYKVSEYAQLEPSNSKRDRFPNQDDNLNENIDEVYDDKRNSNDRRFHEPGVERSYRNDEEKSRTETEHPSTMVSVTPDTAEPVYRASENARQEPSNSKRDRFPNQNDNLNGHVDEVYDDKRNSDDRRFHEPGVDRSYRNDEEKSRTETEHPSTMVSVTPDTAKSFYKASEHARLEPSNRKRDRFPNQNDNLNENVDQVYDGNQNSNDHRIYEPAVERSYRNDNERSDPETKQPSTMVSVTPVAPSYTSALHETELADIIERNLADTPHHSRTVQKDDGIRADDAELDDATIVFDGSCDQIINGTCWVQSEVGDVLTLSLKIDSSENSNSFQIRWMKVYHIFESKKVKPLEIEPAKLPWNMVTGRDARELRLNPVTNTDLDPNCIVAKVFSLAKHRGKTLLTQLKRIVFRIDIPITDMGKIYAGEEVTVNVENFISLPERGNLLFDWSLETKPHQYESLPSSIKVSNSGRSVILKELKRGRLGVLDCVIYSSNRFAIAKRRFNVLKIGDSSKKRSTATRLKNGAELPDLQRSRRCRHVIRRSQEEALQRFREGLKPKSRKKRFRRMKLDSGGLTDLDCEPLKRKYSRLVRSLFGVTEDPKLMPLEKLYELSEEGDGTLDDVIPHEVHYVHPKIRLLSGTSLERSIGPSGFSANCSSNHDCGKHAVCVTPEGSKKSSTGHTGFCNCHPEFYGDGFTCLKIPPSSHRDKRLKRNVDKEFEVPKHLFYERSKKIFPVTTPESAEEEDDLESPPPKILAFEEEESFLLSSCIDNKDCSNHATCIQPTNGHPYCKCRPGFRGIGIFCWEIMDYVPPEEQFIAEDEIKPTGPLGMYDEDRLPPRIPEIEEMQEK